MKLLELRNFDESRPSTAKLVLTTDSSIVTRGLPVFLPDCSSRWRCDIGVAWRVSRLGKSVAAKFAPRYYDAMTLVARLVPLDLCPQGRIEDADVFAAAFDGAVAQGSWIDAAAVDNVALLSPYEEEKGYGENIIDSAFELVSRHITIKNGDIVVARPDCVSIPDVKPGTHIAALLNGRKLLEFNIK